MLDWFTVHEVTLSACIRESAYVRSHVGCGRVHQTLLLYVPQIFQRHKIDANKQDFLIKLNLTYQARSTPKIIGILTKIFFTSCPNLVIPACTGDKLSRRQAQNGVNFDFEVKFDLEGQGQSPKKTMGILTKVFYTYGPNLVILTWMGDELSRGQASDYRTHGQTDGPTHRQTQATTIPKGQNWPWVKPLACHMRPLTTTWVRCLGHRESQMEPINPFMKGRGTTDTIFILRQPQEKHTNAGKTWIPTLWTWKRWYGGSWESLGCKNGWYNGSSALTEEPK